MEASGGTRPEPDGHDWLLWSITGPNLRFNPKASDAGPMSAWAPIYSGLLCVLATQTARYL